jgi:hypothetical protein
MALLAGEQSQKAVGSFTYGERAATLRVLHGMSRHLRPVDAVLALLYQPGRKPRPQHVVAIS